MAKRRKRRKWSDDENRTICAQTRIAGVSVAQVARRYDLNANQIFNWLKDPIPLSGHCCAMPCRAGGGTAMAGHLLKLEAKYG